MEEIGRWRPTFAVQRYVRLFGGEADLPSAPWRRQVALVGPRRAGGSAAEQMAESDARPVRRVHRFGNAGRRRAVGQRHRPRGGRTASLRLEVATRAFARLRVRINARRLDVRVPERRRHQGDGRAVVDRVARVRVPQPMDRGLRVDGRRTRRVADRILPMLIASVLTQARTGSCKRAAAPFINWRATPIRCAAAVRSAR